MVAQVGLTFVGPVCALTGIPTTVWAATLSYLKEGVFHMVNDIFLASLTRDQLMLLRDKADEIISSDERDDTCIFWSVVSGVKTGSEESHRNYLHALQALIYEAESYLRAMKADPELGPREIGLFSQRISKEESIQIDQLLNE